MYIYDAILILLIVFHTVNGNEEDENIPSQSINETSLKFLYSNSYNATNLIEDLRREPSGKFENFCRMSATDFEFLLCKIGPMIRKSNTNMREAIPVQERYLGNDKQIPIEWGNETSILDYWIQDLPLKVTTHGWLSSGENYTGVFTINNAYVDIGGFNVICVDWSSIADDPMYPVPASLTRAVGSAIAAFLDRLVDSTGINPSDIHLIGHSLGAHVVGSCGSNFKSGIIGRITGLDPAAPGYEIISVHLPHLSKKDARFVDIIHTSGGTIGYHKSIGHADFFPNSGSAPQPGCFSLFKLLDFMYCSHSRSYELYADSVYNSLVAIKCPSWDDYKSNKCDNNTLEFMGHNTSPSARGNFFLKTGSPSPYNTNV